MVSHPRGLQSRLLLLLIPILSKICFVHGVVLFHVCLYATTVPVSEPSVEIFSFIINTGNLEYKTLYVIKYIHFEYNLCVSLAAGQ